jgi:sugar fermentation stimulation protein A
MEFKDPLFEGKFIKRYKRFFAEIEYRGETIVAHTANTGSMKGLIETPRPCKFTFIDDPKRTLKYTLQMLKTDTSWVGVNTMLPNHIVAEAFTDKAIAHWSHYTEIKKEVKISSESRIDLVLRNTDYTHYVEVKNVTMAEGSKALFPDAKTERGRKHLHELEKLMSKNVTAEMVFLVQRTDCKSFSPAEQIDAAYSKVLKDVVRSGVMVSAYPVDFLANGIKLKPQKLAVEL